jgi:acyl-CoA thioesterase FadM
MQPKSFYTVRFSDCDPMGHLNNARYIDYMLNAREDHLKQAYQINLLEYNMCVLLFTTRWYVLNRGSLSWASRMCWWRC